MSRWVRDQNRSDMTRILGVALSTVDQWVAKDCPHERTPDGGYLFSIPEWFQWYRTEMTRPPGKEEYTEAQLRVIKAKADMDELLLAEKRGELCSVAEITGKVFEFGAYAANGIQQLPARMAGRLAPLTDAFAIEQELKSEVDEICEHLRRPNLG